VEDERKRDEIAKADENHHAQHRKDLVPDLPDAGLSLKRTEDEKIEDSAAAKRNGAENQRKQELAAADRMEAERLQEKQDQDHYSTV
jgi:hypothetical protein